MKSILFFFLLLILSSLQAQIKVIGHVYDKTDHSPMSSVNIYEKNTSNAVATDFYGKFEINVKNDSAILKITYLGYKDVSIKIKDYKGENIYLEENKNDLSVDYVHTDILRIGFCGDLNKFSYGINMYYAKSPYKFSGALVYKTDLNSNYDFKFNLDKNRINFLKPFNSSLIFQKRKYYDLNVNDYQIIISLPLTKITPKVGFAFKYDYHQEQSYKGMILGFSKYIRPTLTKIYSNMIFYKGFSEYNINISQRLTNKENLWRNLRLGVEYQKYREYDEFIYKLYILLSSWVC